MAKIHDLVTQQEAGFRKPIHLEEGYWWSFKDHLTRSFLYKHSQFNKDNDQRDKRPYKNIIRPILNIHYRTEGFDVKDIEIYVDNAENYYKSFLIKKFHDKWALQHEMDTFIDEVVESFVDYGGVLVKNVDGIRPEVVNLRTIAFCDQTDLLSGAFAIKHYFTPNQLREMKKNGWGETSNNATIGIEDLVMKAENKKQQDKQDGTSETTGEYVEVYEVHGTFPKNYLGGEDEDFETQIHIISFYEDEQGEQQGVTLFAKSEPKLPFKFLARDGGVQGRALGTGAIEELFEAQIWTNFAEIHLTGQLEMASKTFFKTTDPRFKNRNNLMNAKNGQIFDLQQGADITQLDNAPREYTVFNNAIQQWEQHAQAIGAAADVLQGQQPTAGTPFKSLETQLIEGKSLHRYRQGQIAVFIDEIYRDWIIPHLAKEVIKGDKFLVELTANEMLQISTTLVRNRVNDLILEKILEGETPTPEDQAFLTEQIKASFLEGNKKFIEIVKDEMKGQKLNVSTNIAGKQKDLALLTDKLVNVVRQFIATPEIRQDREMIKLLNTILESSGMSPIMFGPTPQLQQPQQRRGGSTEPLKTLGANVREEANATT